MVSCNSPEQSGRCGLGAVHLPIFAKVRELPVSIHCSINRVVTAPADYVYSPYVAELWNSLSSMGIAAVGVVGLAVGARIGLRNDLMVRYDTNWRVIVSVLSYPKYAQVLYVMVVVIGVGSTVFHAHLSYAGQLLDEVPMMLYVLCT